MPCHMTHLLTLSIQVHVVGGFNPPVTHISHPISMLEHVLEGTHQPIAAYIIISLHHHLRWSNPITCPSLLLNVAQISIISRFPGTLATRTWTGPRPWKSHKQRLPGVVAGHFGAIEVAQLQETLAGGTWRIIPWIVSGYFLPRSKIPVFSGFFRLSVFFSIKKLLN
jgi:hypothetical protein